MKMKKIILLFMVFVLLACYLPSPAYAMTKEEALAERDRLQQELIAINIRLAQISDDVEKAQAKLDTLDNRIYIVQQQILLIESAIKLTEDEMINLQGELDKTLLQQQQTFALFEDRIRDMYMSNDITDIELLLGTSTYSDFLLESEYLYRMSESDNDLLIQLELDEKAIQDSKILVQDKADELAIQKNDLDTKKLELAILRAEADKDLSVAQAQEEIAQEDRQAILDALALQEAEWGELMGTGMLTYVGGYYTWPVPGYSYISSPYGPRTLYGVYNMHYGIDIAGGGIYGKSAIASNSGKVVLVRYYTTGYGYHVMIDHGGNQWTVYAHLSSISVYEGQWVAQGVSVGAVGSTGNSTGPHLHFEIRIDGTRVNPEPYLQNRYA